MDSGAIYELEWEKGREGEVLFSGDENNGQENNGQFEINTTHKHTRNQREETSPPPSAEGDVKLSCPLLSDLQRQRR